jgi:hypothetical protein
MATLTVHWPKIKHIMGLGRKLRKEGDVRHLLHGSLRRLLTLWDVARVTIDMLPDVALLEIFDIYTLEDEEEWHTLVHVCRKWRSIVFGSPLRLDLQLLCTARTPVRETLDVWPVLPIVVWSDDHESWGMDNIVAALEHNDRIYRLDLNPQSSHFEELLAAMQQPFPALKFLDLWLQRGDEPVPVVPASFLGGSAPVLEVLALNRIPFPGLPKLLLSATHLVHLRLLNIPHSGYISPEAMVNSLSALIRLESLTIRFEFPQSRPDQRRRRPPPPTRTVIPVLTFLRFYGVSEYLEDLVSRIDAPLLRTLEIILLHQLIFDTPQLTQFIGRTPKLKGYNEAHVDFSDSDVLVRYPQAFDGALELGILCGQSDWQLSSLAQVCSSSFPQALIPMVEHLYIQSKGWNPPWQDDIENGQWLELFHPFSGVKDLYISSEFAPRIVPALQELVGERAMEALPALQNIFLQESPTSSSGPAQEMIGKFVAARQLADHPIAVSHWQRGKR